MNRVLAVFWNTGEHRLRAVWRLLAFALPMAALVVAIGPLLRVAVYPALAPAGPAGPWLRIFLPYVLLAGATTFLAGVNMRYVTRRPLRHLGLQLDRSWWRDLGAGAALSVVMASLLVGVGLLAGWVRVDQVLHVDLVGIPFAAGILAVALASAAQAWWEEIAFRGYPLLVAVEGLSRLGRTAALAIVVVVTSVLFGAAHLANPGATLVAAAGIGLAGVPTALACLLSARMAFPIGVHLAWNFMLGGVFGFPVSGEPDPASVITVRVAGPELWTGGGFGPEAGLLTMLLTVPAVVAVLYYVRRTTGGLRLRLGVPPEPVRARRPEPRAAT